MIRPSIKKQILADLDRMSPEQQCRVQEMVHRMTDSDAKPEGTPGRDLLQFAGLLDEDAARKMERMLEEGCEQIDPKA